MQAERPPENWVYNGTLDCGRKILKDEGTRGLFKGATANLVRTLSAALVLVINDSARVYSGL